MTTNDKPSNQPLPQLRTVAPSQVLGQSTKAPSQPVRPANHPMAPSWL